MVSLGFKVMDKLIQSQKLDIGNTTVKAILYPSLAFSDSPHRQDKKIAHGGHVF